MKNCLEIFVNWTAVIILLTCATAFAFRLIGSMVPKWYSPSEKREILRSRLASIEDKERYLNSRDCLVGVDKMCIDQNINRYNFLRVKWGLQGEFPHKDLFMYAPVPDAIHVVFTKSRK